MFRVLSVAAGDRLAGALPRAVRLDDCTLLHLLNTFAIVLWNPWGYYSVCKSLPPPPILSKFNPIRASPATSSACRHCPTPVSAVQPCSWKRNPNCIHRSLPCRALVRSFTGLHAVGQRARDSWTDCPLVGRGRRPGVTTQIQTECLEKTSPHRYRYANPPGFAAVQGCIVAGWFGAAADPC